MKNFTKLLNLRSSFLLTVLLLLLGSGSDAWAQLTYYSKAASTQFANTASWGVNTDGSGVAPGSISSADNYIIANGSAMTLNGNAAVRTLTINTGSLTVAANTLTVSLATGNNSTLSVSATGTLTVSAAGTLNVNGNFVLASGGIFTQSGGNITVDGNDAGNAATSVNSSTNIVALTGSPTTIFLTGGTFTVVDPHASSNSQYSFWCSTATAINASTSHTLRFGNGVSTDPGFGANGMYMYLFPSSSYLILGNVLVDNNVTAVNNRQVTTLSNIGILGNLTINSGGEYRASSVNTYLTGNLVNNGLLTTTGTLRFASYLNATAQAATVAQTVSGTGLFRNNIVSASSTANFTSVTFNNTSLGGVSFTAANGLLTTSGGINNTGTVSGTLTFTACPGGANLNSGTFIQGISTATVGSTSWTNGGFRNGSFKKWFGAFTLPASVPSTTVGNFPFVENGANRNLQIAASTAVSTAGSVTVTHTPVSGLATVSVVDGAYTIERQTNSNWTVTTGDGLAGGVFQVNASGEGLFATALAPGANFPRLMQGATVVATHANGTGTTTAPVANRTALSAAQFIGTQTYSLGIAAADLGVFSVQTGNWQTGTTWNTGVAPLSTDNVTVMNGHTVTVSAPSVANTVVVNGIVNVPSSTLDVTANATGTGVTMGAVGNVNITGGTMTVGTSTNRFSSLVTNGSFASGLSVSSGILNVNGNILINSPSNFTQSGGTINVDGNAGAVALNSVPSGTSIVNIASINTVLSGGTLNIIDPHVAAASLTSAAFRASVSIPVNATTGHTVNFGNGTSTDNGGSTNGFLIYTFGGGSSYLQFGNVTVTGSAGGTNRHVLTSASVGILGNLSITSAGTAATATGEFRIGASTLFLNGNLSVTAPAAFTAPVSSTLHLADFSNGTLNATGLQTIGGTGVFRNNIVSSSSTGSFTSITVRNTNASSTAVTFSGNALLTPTTAFGGTNTNNSGTVTNNLTLISGNVTTGAGTFIMGSTGVPCGFTYTAGGFTSGSTVARHFTAAGTGTTITALTIPSATLGGTYPFVNGTNNRFFYLGRPSTTGATQGAIAVTFNDGSGVNTIGPVVDGISLDRQSVLNWSVSTPTINAVTFGAGTGTFNYAASGQGSISVANTNARLMKLASVVGTNQIGTILPHVQRTAIPAASFTGAFYIGQASADVPIATTGAGGNWNNTATWQGGVVPTGCVYAQILSGATVTLTSIESAGGVIIDNGGTLTLSSNTLTVGCANNNSSLLNSGTLAVSGTGSLIVNGNVNNFAGSTFSQTGGTITVDGNNNFTAISSVATGTPIFWLQTQNVTMSGGTLIITDPHVGAAAADDAFRYTQTANASATTGHTLQLGDGVSIQAGGNATNGMSVEPFASFGRLMFGNLTVNTTSTGITGNRFVANRFATVQILGNLTITSGRYRVGVNVAVAGNISNAGEMVTTATLLLQSGAGSSTAVASTNAQTISGAGTFGNNVTLASSTANFAGLTINNSNASGITFSNANSLLSGTSTGTVSGTLTFTAGVVNTGANPFILGVSTATLGSLGTYTAGGFGTGSTLARWFAAATTSTITAGTVPSATGAGTYPFVGSNLTDSRFFYVARPATTGATGGTIRVQMTDGIGLNSITAVADAAPVYSIDNQSNANWTVSIGNGFAPGTGTFRYAASALNSFTITNAAAPRLMKAASVVGTYQAGTVLPHAQRDAIAAADYTGTFYLGINNADFPFVSVASSNWNLGTTWNRNPLTPTSANAVIISAGNTVTVSTSEAASTIDVQAGGILNVSTGGVLAVTAATSGSGVTVGATTGQLNLSGTGSMTIGTGATRFSRLTSNGVLGLAGTSSLTVNGNVSITGTGTFNMGGTSTLNIDGNANSSANSVAAGTRIFEVLTNVGTVNGGNITIVDPHFDLASTQTFGYNNASAKSWLGNTLTMGDGASTDASSATRGFEIDDFIGFGILTHGNVVVNGGAAANRWTSTANSTANATCITNLTINANSELRNTTATLFFIEGNIVNNGTFSALNGLNLATPSGTAVAVPQTISGSGTFRNLLASPTASFTSILFNNSNATGVTLSTGSPLFVSSTLTLTLGFVNTSASNELTLGTTTGLTGTLSGGSATAYVRGPFRRVLANPTTIQANATAPFFPVGNGANYRPAHVSAAVSGPAGGSIISVTSNTAATGILGASLAAPLSADNWNITGSGPSTLGNVNIGLTTATASGAVNGIATSSTAGGVFELFTLGTFNATASNTVANLYSNPTSGQPFTDGFFRVATPNTCTSGPATATVNVNTAAVACINSASTRTFSSVVNPNSVGYTYQWSSSTSDSGPFTNIATYTSAAGATSAGAIVTVTSTTGLSAGMQVSVTAGIGAFTATATVSAVTSATTFTVSPAPTTALSGGASVVTATATGTSYTTPALTAAGSLYYRVSVGCSFGPGITDSPTPTVGYTAAANPTAAVTPSNAGNYCGATDVATTLTANPSGGLAPYTTTWAGITGLWTDPSTVAPFGYTALANVSPVYARPSSTTTYTLTVTDANLCTATATQVVTLRTPPVLSSTIATPANICVGATSNLTTSVSPVAVNASAYSFATSAGTFTPIVGGTNSTATGDDGTQTSIPIGFTFNYRNTPFTTFSITTNGAIGLGATAPGWTNGLSTTNNFITALWDDNNRSTGSITYQVTGASPNQILTVEWLNVSVGADGSSANPVNQYQIKLYEATGVIQMVYGTLLGNATTSASIGITGGTAASFVSVTPGGPATASSATANNAINETLIGTSIPTGTTYTFTPPAPPVYTYAWSPVPEIASGGSTASATTTALTGTQAYSVVVSDGTCSSTGNTTVNITALAVNPTATPAPVSQAASSYSFAATNPSGTFTTIVGAGGETSVPSIVADQVISAAIPLGFTFTFGGVAYTNVYASSNGFLSFNATSGNNSGNNLTSGTAATFPLVAPLWDDLDATGTGGAAAYITTGAPGSRVFTFEWRNYEWFWTSSQANISFQVRLFEADGRVQFTYSDQLAAINSPSASIGIATSAGNFLSLSSTGASPTASSASETSNLNTNPATGQTYTFTPPTLVNCSNGLWNLSAGVTGGTPPYTYAWSVPSGVSGLSSTTIANPTVNNVPSNTYDLTVTDGCTPTGSASGFTTRTVFTVPALSITSAGLAYCIGTPLALTATSVPALGITWSGGTGLSTTSTASGAPTLASPVTAQTYTATTDLDVNGCRAFGTIGPVTPAIPPTLASFTANPSAVCIGGFTTLTATPAPGVAYCNPTSGAVNADNITTVTINTLNKSGLSGQLYTNYPAIAPNTTTLTAGTSYNITVGVQISGIVSVWFDFNKNGVFEVSEWFQPMITGASGTVSVPVPAGAINGPTRMRVRSRSSGSPNAAANFCEAATFFSGNAEDFTVTITGGVSTVYNYTWSETPNSTITPANVNSLVASSLPAGNSTYTVIVDDGTCSATQNLVVPVAPLAVTPTTTIVAGASNYEFLPSSGTFTTIVGAPGAVSTPAGRADTYISPAIPLGFNFTFAGTSYSNVYVSSNGFISFNPLATANDGNNITSSAAGNYPLLAPLWDDLDGNVAGSEATYLVTGAPGSQIFTFEWTGWEWFWTSSQNNITFQIKLYEANGRIEFIYSPIINPSGIVSASVGIASAPGNFISLDDLGTNPNIYTFVENATLNTNPAVGQVYAFTPPVASCPGTNALISAGATNGGAPYTYSWTSVPPGFTSTASAINVKPDVTTTYNVIVTDNCGATSPGSATVTVTANPLIVTPSLTSVCGNNPVTINVSGAGSYSFFPNYGIASSTLTSITSVAPPGFVPLAVTGFNSDVVANGIGNVSGSTTADVDGSGNAYFNDFSFQQGPSDPTQAFGAPTNNLVESFAVAGLRYNLAAYTANNSLRLAPAASGTLNTPSNPIATNVYALVAYGGTGGDRTFDATITFTDATTQVFTGLTVKNWLLGTAYSAAGFGYVNNIGVQQGTALTPRVFDVNMAISVPNQTKQVASVAFTYTGAAGIMHVMALTALTVLPAPSLTYTLFGTATGCEFSRQATINYTIPPALTLTSNNISICEGIASPANLVTSNPLSYQSWVWSPTPGDVTGDENTGFIFNPAISKTLTLNATQTSGLLCNASTTVNVTVNGNPGAGTATATPTTICQNSNVALTGSGFNPPNTGTLLNETFEGGVGSNFAVSGAGITASATGVASLSSGAVQLDYINGLTLAGTNNSFELQNDINLNGNVSAQLTFNHICALEGPGTVWDRGVVQYSIDGGATWVAFPAASYAGGNTLTPAAVADGIVFSARSNPGWITAFPADVSVANNTLYNLETINIPSAALTSSQFRIRFKITADGSGVWDGWYLDNIRITAVAPALTYAWSGSGGFTTPAIATIPATLTSAQPTNAGALTLTATNPAGCISEAFTAPLVVSPTPTVANQTQTICGGSTFNVTPVAPVGTTYTWAAPTYDGVLISGGSAQAVGQASISQTLVNTSGAIRTATYVVTPRIGLCDGATFTVVITVYPSLTPPTFTTFAFVDANTVNLGWTATPNAVATGVTYEIDVNTAIDFSGGFLIPTQTNLGLATSYTVTSLTPGTVYYYRIRSINGTCPAPSAWSDVTPFLTTAVVWEGTVSTVWDNQLNWSPNTAIPVATDNVMIFDRINDPTIFAAGVNGIANNLIMRNGAILTIEAGKEINVKANLSSISPGATFTGPGQVNMNGTVAQSISGATAINNLSINNAAGVNLPSGIISVRGIVSTITGSLASNGNLNLVSNAAGTGMISGLTGTGNVTGNVQVNRYMPGVAGYRYVSSPITEITGLTTADFDVALFGANNLVWDPLLSIPSPFPNCWYYDETQLNTYAQYGWTSATPGPIQTGRGYALITPINHTASLVGPVNNGPVSATTQITRTGTQNGAGVNLLGNPYPSPISWNAFRALNGTIEIAGVVKRFASSGSYYGQYVDWNGSVGTPGSVGDQIALGQAFFITKSNAGPLTVNYNNSIRRDNTSTTFYEVDEPQMTSLLRMQLIGGAGADEFVLYFDQAATDNYDINYDAIKFLSETAGIPNIYTNIDSLKVSINVLNKLDQDMVIPMGIVAKTAGAYHVNVLEQETFVPTSMLYLEDRTLGVWTDLRTTDQYTVNLPVGEHNGRFFLHFSPAVNVQVADETCQQADGSVTVSNASVNQQWNASLLNEAGVVVAQSSGANIAFNNLSDGSYTLRLVDANGYSVDQLVTIEAGINVSAAIAPLTSSHYYTTDVVEASVQSVVAGATYEWYLNGVLKGTGTNISMNVTEPGVYTLALKMYGSSCIFETNTSFSVTQESTVGIETANDASGFIVYPNPVRDILNVKINDKIGFTTLSIHDAAGRLIHKEVLNGAKGEQVIQVQMNDYAAGLYQITLEGNQKRSVAKFSKTK